MGVFSGSVGVARYATGAEVPESLKKFVLERLGAFAFRDIEPGSLNEKSIGWVSARNMAVTSFGDLHFAFDPYLVFSLRIDVRRVPALTMKAAVLRRELELCRETSRERLRKQERDTIREEVHQALTRKALPAPAVYDVCWNSSFGVVWFFSTSQKANDDFTHYFARSFDIRLQPLRPANLAAHLGRQKGRECDLIWEAIDFAAG